MNRPNALPRPVSLPLAVAVSLAVSACGGGGGGTDAATPAAVVAAPAASAAAAGSASTPVVADTGTAVTADTTDSTSLAAAMTASAADDTLIGSALAASADPAQPSKSAADTASADTTTASTAAVPTMNIQALPPGNSTLATGRVYYVDSVAGNDTNNGQSATTAAGGAGPWRSLAKLSLALLRPGDTVRLVCGSIWYETLRVTMSGGTATSPITVTSHPAGCSNQPAIDGSVNLPATAWTVHSGNIYKASLAATPLQLFSTAGPMQLAHHPNAGFDATQPASVYLRNAANSDSTTLNGRTVSTYLTTGTDLKLPTGAAITPGTKVRIRTLAWLMDERSISAVNGSRLTLDTPTTYKLDAGWGYFLLGQRWMLDAPGEWHHDAATRTLYAWMPDGRAPSAGVRATTLDTGVDLAGTNHVIIDNLLVRKAGTGVDLRKSTGVQLRNSRIEDTIEHGAYAVLSTDATLSGNVFVRTGTDAISGQEDTTGAANGMRVLNNNLSDIGVTMAGETMLSLPARSRAAIRTGTGALVEGNTLSNAGYIGVWVGAGSTVRNNSIAGTCTVLDDCGGIYTSGPSNNSVISGNVIRSARMPVAGKPAAFARSQSQGIYLDEAASGITVADNTVVDTDNGIHLHVSPNNTLRNNKLYGNRVSQIWLQETRNVVNPLGDLFGNTVTGNQLVPTSASAKGMYLDTLIKDTTRFGTFDLNRYMDTVFPVVAAERALTMTRDLTFPQWQSATANGGTRNLDPNGLSTSQTRFASVLMNGASIVPNGSLSNNSTGWAAWNATKPLSSVVREACTPGWCARYVTGGSAGILSSPNFSIVGGTWYRISVDVATGTDNQTVDMVVRRGGGGTNTYESLSDRSLKLTAGTGWKRYSKLFKATKTVNANDPITRDLGARVDFQSIAPGQVIRVANLELVPIVPAEALTRVDLLLNPTSAATQAACPVSATQPAVCSIYVRLTGNQPVTWPYYLPARSSEIVYTRDARLVDVDGDGIPDQQDSCPATPAGAGVNSRGCALGQ